MADDMAAGMPDVALRHGAAHAGAYVRLDHAEMGWPAWLPAIEGLERWAHGDGREPSGPMRQVVIADARTAAANAPPTSELAVALR